jgi:hypothetical protein
MIINANSVEDALAKGQRIYKCKPDEIKIITIREPSYTLWGLIKKEGEYRIEPATAKRKKVREEKNNDGFAEIVSGKVKVTNPTQAGNYATVDPGGSNIGVYINGSKIESVSIVTEKDTIELRPAVIEAITEVRAELSEDKMKAVLTIAKTPGKQYYVKDTPKTNFLKISLGLEETPAPDATFNQCIQELKRLKVAFKYMNENAIKDLLSRKGGGSAVVAEGIYPVDGRDSQVKYLFESDRIRNPDFDTDDRVDLLDHTVLPMVEVGKVLAVRDIHAVPGRDGSTVTDETIRARHGKETPFRAGKGTMLLDNDTKIVAAANGRPLLANGVVSVVQQLVIPQDVDPETGNVYFNGDVQIKGSVMDNMKVVADGNVNVSGNVMQASIFAKGNVDIKGNIISSRVTAGMGVVNDLYIIPKMRLFLGMIKNDFFDGNSDVWIGGYRKMLERNPDTYSDRKKSLKKFTSDIKELIGLLPDEDSDMIKGILEQLNIIYSGGSAASARQIKMLNEEVQKYMESKHDVGGKDVNIRLKYAQNSIIQANGDILVLGRGTYQTDIAANNSIRFLKPSSVVLGGKLIASRRISMGVVGSPSGISTYCKVLDKNGKIDAVRLYGNTVIDINGKKRVIS